MVKIEKTQLLSHSSWKVEEYSTRSIDKNSQSVLASHMKALEPFSKRPAKSKGLRNISRFFQDRPVEDLVGLCEKYVGKLNKIVDECEQFFKNEYYLECY